MKRVALLLAIVAAGAMMTVVLVLFEQVRDEATRDDARPAQAIVVFGAAEYAGRPSPALRARLDHALTLHHRGLASVIVTTGGPGGDPNFTEAGVERNYLVEHGVPPENILVEDQSTTTDQTVVQVAEVLARTRITTCIVVSDGYHLFRIKRQLAASGVTAFGSPRTSNAAPPVWACFKQVFAYLLWKVGIRI